jgi:hypothetical protein
VVQCMFMLAERLHETGYESLWITCTKGRLMFMCFPRA